MATASPDAERRPDAVFAFPDGRACAAALAGRLGLPFREVELHHFPDGESRVRVAAPSRRPLVFRTLDNPNAKLVEILLCAGALRDAGARRIVLAAPYLGYMRQDTAFSPGEAVSQRIIGALLASHVDAVLSVDPHLHRTASLSQVFAGKPALAVSAAPAIARHLAAAGYGAEILVLGPDEESRPWVQAVAAPLGAPWATAAKLRSGDRRVDITLPAGVALRGRRVVIVDDIVSTGGTLAMLAARLAEAGAVVAEACVTHALFSPADHARLTAAGIPRIVSTTAVAHPTNGIDIVPEIAKGLEAWP